MTRLILGVAAALLLTAGQAAADGRQARLPRRGGVKSSLGNAPDPAVRGEAGDQTDQESRSVGRGPRVGFSCWTE